MQRLLFLFVVFLLYIGTLKVLKFIFLPGLYRIEAILGSLQ